MKEIRKRNYVRKGIKHTVSFEHVCEICETVFMSAHPAAKTCGVKCRKKRSRTIPLELVKPRPGYVYAIQGSKILNNVNRSLVKLGLSKHPEKRIMELSKEYPDMVLTFIEAKQTDDMISEEMRIHGVVWDKHVGKEWFDISVEEARHIIIGEQGK